MSSCRKRCGPSSPHRGRRHSKVWKEAEVAKILLVEDNEMNRDMLLRRLSRNGHEVLVAVDGEQAVAAAGRDMPEIVLMDVGLPGIDGYEATRRIRATDATTHLPVIALTAHAM